MKTNRTGSQRAMDYANLVRSGKRKVPVFVKQAVEKWFLYRKKFGFNEKEVNRRCKLAERFYLPEGKKQKLVLMPWQCWVVSWLYGFWDKNGNRAMLDFLVLVPRKAGKTTLVSALILLELVFPSSKEQEHKPDILVTGETDDVCNIAYKKLTSMLRSDIRESGGFCQEFGVEITKTGIWCAKTEGTIGRLSAGAKSHEGYTLAMVYCDEMSRMPTDHAVQALRSGFMHNPDAFFLTTTTYSDAPTSVLFEEREMVKNWLENPDDFGSQGGAMYETPTDVNFLDERWWKTVQPAWEMGTKVERFYRQEAKKAMFNAGRQYSFKVRQLCMALAGGVAWIGEEHLTALEEPEEEAPPTGNEWRHYIGADFGDTLSTSSLCLLSYNTATEMFEARFKIFYCSGMGYVEEDDEEHMSLLKESPVHMIYNRYAKEGHVNVVEGPVIDHGLIAQGIQDWIDKDGVQVNMILADFYNAFEEVRAHLPDRIGKHMHQMSKHGKNMTASANLLSNFIRQKRIKMRKNPVVLQHFKNVMAVFSQTGSLRLQKPTENSPHKIDAVDAFVQAMLAHNVTREVKYYGTIHNPIDNTADVKPGKSEDEDNKRPGSWVLSH